MQLSLRRGGKMSPNLGHSSRGVGLLKYFPYQILLLWLIMMLP